MLTPALLNRNSIMRKRAMAAMQVKMWHRILLSVQWRIGLSATCISSLRKRPVNHTSPGLARPAVPGKDSRGAGLHSPPGSRPGAACRRYTADRRTVPAYWPWRSRSGCKTAHWPRRLRGCRKRASFFYESIRDLNFKIIVSNIYIASRGSIRPEETYTHL